MNNFRRNLISSFLALICPLALLAEPVDQFLEKARSQLGTEAKLDAVESLRYDGEVVSPTGEVLSQLELVFSKPNRQLLRETRDERVNQTAVNGYEGYVMAYEKGNPKKRMLQVLPPGQVKRLMANAVENLNFFQGPEVMRNAKIVDGGQVDYEGQTARMIRFEYPTGLVYTRYFDPNSAQLLATVSSDGLTMIERESIASEGVKFPKVVDTYDETGALLRTVQFQTIEVNGQLEPDLFDFPN